MNNFAKIFFVVALSIIADNSLHAQAVVWRQILGDRYNDQGYNCIQLRNGGYMMAGYSEILIPGTPLIIPKPFIVKFDFYGNIVWEKIIGDSLTGGSSSTLIEDTYGNIYMTIYTNTPFLIKLDSNGNILWSKNYFNVEVLKGISFTDNFKFLIFLSQTNGTSSITKLDSSGNMIWNKAYYDSIPIYYSYFSGNNSFYFTDKYYLISGARGNVGFVIKTDTSGNVIWNRKYENWGVYSISRNSENTFIASCQADAAGKLYCQKFNINGDLIWGRSYNSDSSAWAIGYRKIIKSNDNSFALGTTAGHNFGRFMLIDSTGNILTSKFYYYPVNFAIGQSNLNITSDSGYITVGYLDSNNFFSAKNNLTENSKIEISESKSGQKRIDALVFKIDKYGNTVSVFNYSKSIESKDVISIYPNPYNSNFAIKIVLIKKSKIKITMYDLSGKHIKTIVITDSDAGNYKINLNTSVLSSGIYFLKILVNNDVYSHKILQIK